MKKIAFIATLALVLLVSSCKEDKKEPEFTIFKGTIENVEVDSISIRRNDFVEKIAVKEDGTFTDTLELPENGYYILRVDREIAKLFLAPGTTNSVSLDTKEFDESLKYSGDNAAANNYLAQKFLLSEKIDVSPSKLIKKGVSKDSMAAIATKNKQQYLDLLHQNKKLDSSFVAMEEKAIGYKNKVALYIQSLLSQSKNPDSLASKSNSSIITDIDMDNAEDYKNFSSYRQLVQIDFMQTMRTSGNKKNSTISTIDHAFSYLENVKSENIKNDLLESLSYKIRPGNEEAEKIYSKIMATSTDEEFKKELSTRYEKIQKLAKGSPSPTFTFENYEGGKTSLKDLRGKYAYIDVWATWCKPCLAQLPALKKIEEKYHGKNIQFVSISIDTEKAYDTWRNMIDQKELGGIQLIADNAWESDFVKEYAIRGIPRFILIDPEGNIVSANAPRPTNPELITLFENQGI